MSRILFEDPLPKELWRFIVKELQTDKWLGTFHQRIRREVSVKSPGLFGRWERKEKVFFEVYGRLVDAPTKTDPNAPDLGKGLMMYYFVAYTKKRLWWRRLFNKKPSYFQEYVRLDAENLDHLIDLAKQYGATYLQIRDFEDWVGGDRANWCMRDFCQRGFQMTGAVPYYFNPGAVLIFDQPEDEDSGLYRTNIQVEVLSDRPIGDLSLSDIAHEGIHGDFSLKTKAVTGRQVSRREMALALEAQGSDPGFLLGEDGWAYALQPGDRVTWNDPDHDPESNSSRTDTIKAIDYADGGGDDVYVVIHWSDGSTVEALIKELSQ